MKTLIKNAAVVNAKGTVHADILLNGDTIAAVAPGLECESADILDARGCLIFPGFIDTHTHFDLDLGYTKTADDFITGTKAALLGGTTTVLDFATQDAGGALEDALSLWHEKAKGSSCNYGFHMAIAGWSERTRSEMQLMSAAGVTSYKLYMVYDALRVDDGAIYAALKAARDENALVGVHCENWDVLNRMAAEVKARGISGPQGHPLSRPAPVEAEAVARLMRIAQLANAPVYVVHLSTKEGLTEALRARERGQEVYLETCPQYLLLSDERYSQPDGAKFVMSPPLRTPNDNAALWNALADGSIDFIGTDHCSFTLEQKARGKDDFTKMPNGGAGVQHRAELIYNYGVRAGKISAERMAELLSYNPSRLFGMEERGEIAPGKAADVVIWDPDAQYRISDTNTAHNCDNSPFAGFEAHGRARYVFINGVLAVKDFALARTGEGRYIHRKGAIHTR